MGHEQGTGGGDQTAGQETGPSTDLFVQDQWVRNEIREQLQLAGEVNNEQVDVINKLVDNQDRLKRCTTS